jgi:hypothetical protein
MIEPSRPGPPGAGRRALPLGPRQEAFADAMRSRTRTTTRTITIGEAEDGNQDPRLSDIAQKGGDPSNEREFDAINVKFFVIKKGLY